MRTFALLLQTVVLSAALFGHAAATRADILGFGDFSNFTINQADAASGPAEFNDKIKLTTLAPGESRSIFYNTPQTITGFTAAFTYQAVGTPSDRFGVTFVLENDQRGADAVSAPLISGEATQFGYTDFFGGIRPSVAISLEYGSLSSVSSSTGQYSGGGVGGGSNATDPVNLFSGDPIDVVLSYNGVALHEHLEDPTAHTTFDVTYPVDIPALVGGTSAIVGFTAASGLGTVEQSISNFQFNAVAVPEPSSLLLLGCGLAALVAGKRFTRSIRSSRLADR